VVWLGEPDDSPSLTIDLRKLFKDDLDELEPDFIMDIFNFGKWLTKEMIDAMAKSRIKYPDEWEFIDEEKEDG
jgi:hypothetical protein